MAKLDNLTLRKNRVRAKIGGTAERPRLSVYVSNKNITAQLVDDINGQTLAYVRLTRSSLTVVVANTLVVYTL